MSEIKTFTAKEMHNNPAKVFREADKKGKAIINHDHYKDIIFMLISRERGANSIEPEEG